MSKNMSLTAVKREGSGKGTARAIRRNKQVPAVIYGDNKAPVSIALDLKPLTLEYLKGHIFNTLCNLDVEGEKYLVLARDLQLDPVTDVILHADFLRVTAKTKLSVKVPVHFSNQETCPGIKAGGTLVISHHELAVMVPANNIPEQIEIDLASVAVGHAIKLSEIKLPKGVSAVVSAEDAETYTVASIVAPRVSAEEAPAEGEAAAA